MGILKIDLNNMNLDNNFDEDNPDTIILIILLAWHIKFEKRKELKTQKNINEGLIQIVWHPKGYGIFAFLKMRKFERFGTFCHLKSLWIVRIFLLSDFLVQDIYLKVFKII